MLKFRQKVYLKRALLHASDMPAITLSGDMNLSRQQMINVWPFFFTVLWNRWDLLPIKSKSKLQMPPISSKYIIEWMHFIKSFVNALLGLYRIQM